MRPDQLYLKTVPEFFTEQHLQEFAELAMQAYPYEACAYIIDCKLVPVENIAANPYEEFQLSTEDSFLATKAQGFVHSHPDGPFHPTAIDMLSQKNTNIPFGIITCTDTSASKSIWLHNGTLDVQLEGRPFVHGIYDCYSLVRAYYWQSRKIKLLDFPRDFEWWESNPKEEMYLNNFEKAGFRPLKSDEAMEEGDIILMNIQSSCVSHAAIYLGNGLILHHLRSRISKKDQATQWKKFFHTTVRYVG